MVLYYPYNQTSTVRVEETLTVANRKIFLRHIPKKGSVVIEGFAETDSVNPAINQFSCQYSTDSSYRDANRVLNFNAIHNGEEFFISYIAVGTVLTAEDMNEIKAHLENDSIHANAIIDAWEIKGNAYAWGGTSGSDQHDVLRGIETTVKASGEEHTYFILDKWDEENPDYPDTEKDFACFEIEEVDEGNEYIPTEIHAPEYLVSDGESSLRRVCHPLAVHLNKQWYLLERIDAVYDWRMRIINRIKNLEHFLGMLDYNDWSPSDKTIFIYSRTFMEKFGRYPEYGDIVYLHNTNDDRGIWAFHADDAWFSLDYSGQHDPSEDYHIPWTAINPWLTTADRALLDYLHEQFDDQLEP